MNIKHSIGLNLSADAIPGRLHMVQGDSNSRTIVATLWDGAQLYSIPTGAAVMVRFRKPDGTGGLYDATESGSKVSYAGSIVTAPVATQMLAVAGDVFAEIDIFGSGSGAAAERLATFRFIVEVAPCVLPDAEIISSDYYNILASDIADAKAAADLAKDYAAAAKQSADNAATSVEGAVKYNSAQTLTDAQKQQARDNINAPAPYTAGENISISGSVIATKAFPCNPHLLDNWYFGNPVNQREGRIVPAGTPYFVPGSSTQAGVLSSLATVIGYLDSGGKYPQVKVGGETYITPIGTDIPGYVGAGYTIDRWKLDIGESVTIDNGLNITKANSYFGQYFDDFDKYIGMQMAGSVLMSDGGLYTGTFVYNGVPDQGQTFFANSRLGMYIQKLSTGLTQVEINSHADNVKVRAVGLELGSQQTLAHQENGVWVLNEIPDYGEQLRRCQRYLFAANSDSYPYACVGSGYISSDGTESIIIIPTPVSLKKLPVCEIKGVLRVDTSYGEIVTLTSAAIYNIGSGAVCIHGKFTGTATAKAPCYALLDTGDNLFLSADL